MIALLFSAGIQKRLLMVIPIGIALVALYLLFLDPERLSRVTSFTDPGNTELQAGDGYQLWNSLLALGSGGWTGVGFMESKMKQLYLPESHTDFILAVVGEELGYIGLLGVIAGYLLFGYFGLKIALNSRSRFGMLLAVTITSLIVLQAGINIGVVSGALPTKGISAPMISYGGSNLLMNMIMVGLLVSVGLENVPGLTDNWPWRKNPNQN
jgi:cell division protein FtsW